MLRMASEILMSGRVCCGGEETEGLLGVRICRFDAFSRFFVDSFWTSRTYPRLCLVTCPDFVLTLALVCQTGVDTFPQRLPVGNVCCKRTPLQSLKQSPGMTPKGPCDETVLRLGVRNAMGFTPCDGYLLQGCITIPIPRLCNPIRVNAVFETPERSSTTYGVTQIIP